MRSVGSTVHLLDFGAVVEAPSAGGATIVRIDEATAPGRVSEAHAALQPYLATGAALGSDVADGAPLRVAAMLFDVDGRVVRLRLEPTDAEAAVAAFEE
jgi:hypothetical protein